MGIRSGRGDEETIVPEMMANAEGGGNSSDDDYGGGSGEEGTAKKNIMIEMPPTQRESGLWGRTRSARSLGSCAVRSKFERILHA